MKIDEFDKDEQAFLLGNIGQMTVPFNHAEYEKISALGRSCVLKLQKAIEAEGETLSDKSE